MNCIKCGVTIQEPQVFCDQCLKDMERYPVKANVQVNLPVRPASSPAKKRNRRQRGSLQEEQLRRMKFKLRLAHVALVIVFAAFLVLAGMMLKMLSEPNASYAPGQNYSTIPSTDPS